MNLRFSLFSLICFTTFAALACAALSRPNGDWLSLIVTGAAVVFVIQLLTAILLAGQSRAAAIGWLLFAAAYLAVTVGPWLAQNLGPHLLTSRGLAHLRSEAPWGQSDASLWIGSTGSVAPFALDGTAVWVTDVRGQVLGGSPPMSSAACFHLTAHWLLAIVFGGIGAKWGAWLERRRNQGLAAGALSPAQSAPAGAVG